MNPMPENYQSKPPRFSESNDAVNFTEEPQKDLKPVDLTLMAVIRDCGSRVREWLAFHRVVGFNRFLIALHDCKDDTEDQIKSLPFYKDIVIHHIDKSAKLPQLGGYRRMMEHYRSSSKWIAILDDDEFLFSPIADNLMEILPLYEAYGGVTANWRWFGSNNHVLRPKGLVMESYTRRAVDDYMFHRGCKSIFQTSRYIDVISPHLVKTDIYCVNEGFQPVPNWAHWENGINFSAGILRCNHYKVKSMEDWCDRVRRGDCTLLNPAPVNVDRFKIEDRNDIEDFMILKYAGQVKEILEV